jgi:hypothetical protein
MNIPCRNETSAFQKVRGPQKPRRDDEVMFGGVFKQLVNVVLASFSSNGHF